MDGERLGVPVYSILPDRTGGYLVIDTGGPARPRSSRYAIAANGFDSRDEAQEWIDEQMTAGST